MAITADFRVSQERKADTSRQACSSEEREPATQGFHRLERRQLIGTVIGLQLALLLASLDQTIVSTAMPKIVGLLGGFERYTWVTTAYMLTSTIALPIVGKLSDLFGRKWILMGSILGFVLASALCGTAGNIPLLFGGGMNQLIIFRALQGIGGGALMALAFTVIGDIFPPAERGKYQGLFSGVFALSSVIGPALGGWITDHASWRWVFLVNLPVGAVALAVIYFAFPYFKPKRSGKSSIDYLGASTLIGFVVPLLLALTWVPEAGWMSTKVITMLALSLVLFAAFLVCESEAMEPIIPLSLFTNPSIVIASISLFVLGLGMFAAILFIPLFMQTVIGVSATKSGSLLTPMMLTMTCASMASGQIVSRIGKYKSVALFGLTTMGLGMWLLSSMSTTTNEFHAMLYMIVVGLGLGTLMPIYTLVSQNSAPANMLGAATAATQFLRSIGATLGTALFGSLVVSNFSEHLNAILPASIPPSLTEVLANPLQLGRIQSVLAQTSGINVNVVLAAIKSAFAFSLINVFHIAALSLLAVLIVNLFLKELPLRRSHHHEQGVEVPAH